MKKFAKMSLVAAFAVAGLTSTASAGSLEEAIKGVNISGDVSYRLEKVTNTSTGGDSEAQHDIDYSVNFSVPVNDNVTANLRAVEAYDDDTSDDDGVANASAIGISVDRAFFTYANNGLTVNAGLTSMPLSDGVRADGITVAKSFNGIDLSAGYFYSNDETEAADVYFVTASGSIDALSYYATYGKVTDADAADDNTADITDLDKVLYQVGLSANLDPVTVAVDYSSNDADSITAGKQTQYKVSVSGTLGAVNLSAAYAANGADGGKTLIDGSDAAASNISIGGIELEDEDDASAYLLSASTALGDKGTAKVRYAASKNNAADSDLTVLRVNYDYAMSSNFTLGLEYTVNTDEDAAATDNKTDYVMSAKYTF